MSSPVAWVSQSTAFYAHAGSVLPNRSDSSEGINVANVGGLRDADIVYSASAIYS